jgi:hypothetical protein
LFGNLVIEKPTVESILRSTMESGLGLDISKTSTGIAIYENGVVETYKEVPEFDEDSDLRYYYMVKALEDDLLTLIKGKHFDIIAIEDSIQGENYKTVRMLALLNSVIDKIIGEGNVTCNYFRRIENTTWKKWLRTLRASEKKYENDKHEIQSIFKHLGYDFAIQFESISDADKKRIGYQDQLDALGVLIGAGLERLKSGGTLLKKKELFKLNVELFSSEEEVKEKYDLSTLTRISLSGDLNAAVRKFFANLEESRKLDKFYMVTDTLGTLGIERGMQDASHGLNHVVLYQTPRKT